MNFLPRLVQKRLFLPIKWRLMLFRKYWGFEPMSPVQLGDLQAMFESERIKALQDSRPDDARYWQGKLDLVADLFSYGYKRN